MYSGLGESISVATEGLAESSNEVDAFRKQIDASAIQSLKVVTKQTNGRKAC